MATSTCVQPWWRRRTRLPTSEIAISRHKYHRIAGRRGKKRAAVAVGHTILVIIYHLLRDGGEYQDLGRNYFDELKEERVVRRMERRLQALGYEVTLEKKAA